MRFRIVSFILTFGYAAVSFANSAHAQQSFGDAFWQYRVATEFDYSVGRYGAKSDTEIVYTAALLRASKGPWVLKAVVPYLWLSGPSLLLDAGAGGSVSSGQSRSVSGPGDVLLYGTYSLESLYNRGLFVDLTFRLKLPSASFAKGLGTGKADEALQLDVQKSIGHFWPFITFGYRFTGNPTGYMLRNVIYGTAGLQYTWSDTIATGAYFDYRQSALHTLEDPRDGTVYMNVRFARAWAVNIYGVAGFSKNSPRAGGGLVLSYKWP